MHYFPERYINIELFRRFDYQILVPFLETFREYLERQPGFFWTKDCHEFPYLVMGRILHNYDNSAPISLFESFYHVQTLAQKCCRSELISIAQKENIKADFRHLPVHDLALLLLTQSPKSLEILHAKLFSDLNGRRLRRLDSFFIRDKRKTMNIPVQHSKPTQSAVLSCRKIPQSV